MRSYFFVSSDRTKGKSVDKQKAFDEIEEEIRDPYDTVALVFLRKIVEACVPSFWGECKIMGWILIADIR